MTTVDVDLDLDLDVDVDVDLRDGESLMTSSEELAYRQITKHMMDGDKVSSTAFGPASIDKDMPSFSRSEAVTAQEARDWHNQNARSASLGVWAVSVDEVFQAGRYVVDDANAPLEVGEIRSPGHCFVDFRGLSRFEKKDVRGKLYLSAMDRREIPTEMPVTGDLLFE